MPNKAYYDLHIHSCLSPCGDNEMTPGNVLGMAMLKGLNIVALTDHNTLSNCPAFFDMATDLGIIPIAGTEITTAEDIHVLTLFDTLEGAMDFNSALDKKRMKIKNNPDIFGKQLLVDSNDNVVGEEEYLLINSVELSIDDICDEVKKYSGVGIPAHIDKNSNSVVAVLGTVPDGDFTAYELFNRDNREEYSERFPHITNSCLISNSDAHYLWDINEKINYFEIFSDVSDVNGVTQELFSYLRGEKT